MSQMHREQWTCADCGVHVNTKSQWQEHNRTYHGKIVTGSGQHPMPAAVDDVETMQSLQMANSAKMAELMSAAFLPFMQAMLPTMNLNLLSQAAALSAQQILQVRYILFFVHESCAWLVVV